MKMPEGEINPILFAPCGVNCMVCYKHCDAGTPCAGCLQDEKGKPAHCRKCKIKDCIREKRLAYCFECPGYPCPQIRYLDKSYRTRYGVSLMENSAFVKEHGPTAFMKRQQETYRCPVCGGIISLQDTVSSDCRKKTP